MTPKRNSLVKRTAILLDELKEYIGYLERRIETQNQLIQSLQQTIDAYGSFVRDLRILHKGTPTFVKPRDNINDTCADTSSVETITIDSD